jgi:hypothetical protein
MTPAESEQFAQTSVTLPAFVATDLDHAGCFRFSSMAPAFPLSIAFPAWSRPVVDIDRSGFGTVNFDGAFVVRRTAILPDSANDTSLARHAHDLFAERQAQLARMRRLFDPGSRPVELKALMIDANPTIRLRIPEVSAMGSIVWGSGEELCFTTHATATAAWHISYDYKEIDFELLSKVFASITWLGPEWFSALPAL